MSIDEKLGNAARDHSTDMKNLGFFSNRNGEMRRTGVDIVVGSWQFVAVTGEGDSATSSTGTSTFWLGDETNAPIAVGTISFDAL